VRVHNEQETWEAKTPTLGAADTEANARLFRNHILGGGTVPEHWFGGGGDVNRAVGAEMGEPTFKVLTQKQRAWKHFLELIARFVLEQAAQRQGLALAQHAVQEARRASSGAPGARRCTTRARRRSVAIPAPCWRRASGTDGA
jgi:GNAT superfamily N-acetyltransferase